MFRHPIFVVVKITFSSEEEAAELPGVHLAWDRSVQSQVLDWILAMSPVYWNGSVVVEIFLRPYWLLTSFLGVVAAELLAFLLRSACCPSSRP